MRTTNFARCSSPESTTIQKTRVIRITAVVRITTMMRITTVVRIKSISPKYSWFGSVLFGG